MGRASTFRLILQLFPGRERLILAAVCGSSLVAAVFEAAGVASILPFMALVLDPTALNRYAYLRRALDVLEVSGTREMLLAVGVITVTIVALGNFVAALNVVVQQKFVARTETRIASALFTGYMSQQYAFHVRRDGPSLLKVLNSDVNAVVNGVILPAAQALSRLLVGLAILALLLLHDPAVSLTVAAVLLLSYVVTYQVVRRSQDRLGVTANDANVERVRLSQEALGGIKELQILGRTAWATGLFRHATDRYVGARSLQQIGGQLPKFVLETVAFGGILLITLALVASSSGGAQRMIPVLALYAFAGYRLMPALQIVYASVVAIRYYQPVLRSLHEDFLSVGGANANIGDGSASIEFRSAVRLDRITFWYEGAPAPSLRDVSLTIRPTESVGLVGRTGAGKTTLADLILGLYEPQSGTVSIDGIRLTRANTAAWQRRVGYVPQSVFLSNASVAANIALGVPEASIDQSAVRRAAQMAQADEFIRSMPQAYDTIVGERGVKLSGGQRQRIGIARALYHDPSVLVFDEATSALDGLTEDAVMEAITSLAKNRTIILIAHRLRTVEACDRIVMLDRGEVVEEGSYQELLRTSEAFRQFVGRPALAVNQ